MDKSSGWPYIVPPFAVWLGFMMYWDSGTWTRNARWISVFAGLVTFTVEFLWTKINDEDDARSRDEFLRTEIEELKREIDRLRVSR